ncbi:MAG: transposase [Patescibacteria group bacterium]|jgi:REP element-mobilizing transposase RayT
MIHLYFDDCYYFVTRSTNNHEKLFDTADKKKIILNRLMAAQKKFNFSLHAFSIISNHYHYLIYLPKGEVLPKLEQFIAGGSSHELNVLNNIKRSVWGEYWEKVVDEEKLKKVLGYILGNLLKHGEAKNFDELNSSPFTSCKQGAAQYGEQTIQDLILSVNALNLEDRTNFDKLFK